MLAATEGIQINWTGIGDQQPTCAIELGIVRVGQFALAEHADRLERHRIQHLDAAVAHVGDVDQLAVVCLQRIARIQA